MNIDSVFQLKLAERFPCDRLRKPLHELIPGHSFRAVLTVDHGDALLDRTDEETERAAYAIVLPYARLAFSVHLDKVDALVCRILACDMAEIALNAL